MNAQKGSNKKRPQALEVRLQKSRQRDPSLFPLLKTIRRFSTSRKDPPLSHKGVDIRPIAMENAPLVIIRQFEV